MPNMQSKGQVIFLETGRIATSRCGNYEPERAGIVWWFNFKLPHYRVSRAT